MLDGSLAPVPWEDQDPAMVQEIQGDSSGYTLDVLRNQLLPRDAVETTPGGDEYVVSDTVTPNSPCSVSNPDVVSECGLSELPSCIHSDDETEHDAFLAQTCLEEVENAKYAAPLKPLLSTRGKEPLHEELDPPSRLREYVDSKMILVAKKLCYARPTLCSWPLKQGSIGDISGLKENLEQKITTWQREVDLKLMKSVWGAHVRTHDLSCKNSYPVAPRWNHKSTICAWERIPKRTTQSSPASSLQVCQENHTRLKLKKCEFMQETMQYLGFDIGYGLWAQRPLSPNP